MDKIKNIINKIKSFWKNFIEYIKEKIGYTIETLLLGFFVVMAFIVISISSIFSKKDDEEIKKEKNNKKQGFWKRILGKIFKRKQK